MNWINLFHEFSISSRPSGLNEITSSIIKWLNTTNIQDGLLTVFIPHTSCSLLIQENADPEVQLDLEDFFQRLVPYGDPLFRHTAEGPDDMPAHIRSALTQTHLSIAIKSKKLMLGTWQGVYVYEHRQHSHHRQIYLQALGNSSHG